MVVCRCWLSFVVVDCLFVCCCVSHCAVRCCCCLTGLDLLLWVQFVGYVCGCSLLFEVVRGCGPFVVGFSCLMLLMLVFVVVVHA